MLRSLARILLGVTVGIALLAFAAFFALRQPTFARPAFLPSTRAEAPRLRAHVTFLADPAHPRSAAHPEHLARAADYIAAQFRAAGARVSEQSFPARGAMYRNVIASFGPDDRSLPLLVVGAHYDAFGDTGVLPGADDNASGTAGLIELARILARAGVRRPVQLVAYANEEPPFFGSEQMGSAVHARSIEGRPLFGMISLEMIGYFSDEQTWPSPVLALLYPDRGDFIGVTGGWEDRALTRFVKNAMRGAGGIDVLSFNGPREMVDASDQRSYWARGRTAVMVTDTAYLRNPHYHTSADTAATLDYQRMSRVVDGVANAILHFARGAPASLPAGPPASSRRL